eukprot:snap_masked-scaffold_14-processed-gene-10.58-mRNA-1 protein AED:1.00 eAED:1.00 QI:0/0/0/0/1/1/2/0/65
MLGFKIGLQAPSTQLRVYTNEDLQGRIFERAQKTIYTSMDMGNNIPGKLEIVFWGYMCCTPVTVI